eukprot:4441085-Amphidinium_carterae.2
MRRESNNCLWDARQRVTPDVHIRVLCISLEQETRHTTLTNEQYLVMQSERAGTRIFSHCNFAYRGARLGVGALTRTGNWDSGAMKA